MNLTVAPHRLIGGFAVVGVALFLGIYPGRAAPNDTGIALSHIYEPPVPVRAVAPKYPFELRRDGIEGIVLISCVIDPVGNVTELTVEKTTNPAFNKPALDALKKWKFKPAKLDGNPVAKKIVIPLKFIIEEP